VEVSFSKEIESLRLGDGETFHGEGILAITKALLQSGVAYVGGYQGAPVSHLMDVLVQARGYMDELGVHVEACSNEASAAAMLGASIHYPLRGAVTWKSIVGTNVAADALSNLSSPGVKGGVLVVVGEDYGEGASVIQERTHAYALKSGMILLDPRPDLGRMVDLVEHGFGLSEASNMPALMELRIRACHVRGSFTARDNRPPAISTRALMMEPAAFDYARLAHPPVTFRHEKLKYEERIPAARRYIVEHGLNELLPGKHDDLGLIVQGGLTNTLVRALQQFGLADAFGELDIPTLVLNVTSPLVPDQIAEFCAGKRAVLVLEEGQPEYIEQEIATLLRRRDIQTPLQRQGPAAHGRRVHRRGHGRRPGRLAEPGAAGLRHRLGAGLAGRQPRAPRRGGEKPARAAARPPAGLLHRLPGASGVLGDQIGAAHGGPGARGGGHRLPCLCHLRAVFDRPHHPRLWHEPGQPRGGVAAHEPTRAVHHGRRRLLAQRPADRRAERAVQRRRCGAADLQERLHLGHRHAGHPPRRMTK
jgi:indolepyruvate ferredoxin oxidoreductase alpha subunit